MTPESQRIAIAEACGWKVHPKDKWVVIPPNSPHSVQPLYTLPDYLNDLNAMHKAKLSLSPEELGTFTCILIQMGVDRNFHFMVATAEQQAEAFLRTIDKWKTKENKP
jgi:hypothetical protein